MKLIERFSDGVVVRQKCGGPPMLVVAVNDDYPCNDSTVGGVFCTWEENQTLYEHIFSPYALDILYTKMPVPIFTERRSRSRNQ